MGKDARSMAPIVRVLQGHVLDQLALLDPESVHMACTSPPYWGLRDYSKKADGTIDESLSVVWRTEKGEWKGQLGLEPTFSCGAMEWGSRDKTPCASCYLCHVAMIGAALKRVLRSDGVLWWNQGDSYAGGGGYSGAEAHPEWWDNSIEGGDGKMSSSPLNPPSRNSKALGLQPGDLIDQSGRVAAVLQAVGWIWRSRVVVAKSNPMPESADNRPTRSHEMFLMLAKSSENTYWTHRDGRGARKQPEPDYRWQRVPEEYEAVPVYDLGGGLWELKAVKSDVPSADTEERDSPPPEWQAWHADPEDDRPERETGWRRINLWTGHAYYYDADAVRETATNRAPGNVSNALYDEGRETRLSVGKQGGFDRGRWNAPVSLRNLRDVWQVSTQAYPGAHYATFGEALVERPIRSSTSERGCCVVCGAPWASRPALLRQASRERGEEYQSSSRTLGWQPTCEHKDAEVIPCVVLDPFAGSGTTLLVARKLGRWAIGIELKGEYVEANLRPRLGNMGTTRAVEEFS